ncbi:hypothetical protein, partial [Dickeya dianthicola]|uniref:hypothetical protein n=1 Tax=Dickeya dianthicola TaxID=204039 RepID=UPI001F2BC932
NFNYTLKRVVFFPSAQITNGQSSYVWPLHFSTDVVLNRALTLTSCTIFAQQTSSISPDN